MDKRINVKISNEDKVSFNSKCKEEGFIPSVVIRKLVKDFTEHGVESFK